MANLVKIREVRSERFPAKLKKKITKKHFLKKLADRFSSSSAVFLTLYTTEAHPAERRHYKDYFLDIKEHKWGNFWMTQTTLA